MTQKKPRSMSVSALSHPRLVLMATALVSFIASLSAFAGPKEDFDKTMALFWQHERFVKAGDEFILSHPNDVELVAEMNLQVGWGYWWLGNHKEARGYFQEAIDLTPNNRQRSAQAAVAIGWMHLLEKDYDKAIEKLEEQIVSYDPLYRDAAQIHLANAYFYKRDFATAARLFEYILERAALPGYETRYLEALKKRAQCQTALKDYENALVSTKLYLCFADQNAPTYIRTLKDILRIMKRRDGDMGGVIEYINYQRYGGAGKDGQLGTPDDLDAPIISDRIMYDRGIAKDRDGAAKIQQGDIQGYIERGSLHLFLGEADEAIADFRKANLLAPPSPKMRKSIIADVAKAVMLKTGSIFTLNQYLKYIRYGRDGPDAKAGTDDDLASLPKDLQVERMTDSERMPFDRAALDDLIAQTDDVIVCLDLMLSLSRSASTLDASAREKTPAFNQRRTQNQPLHHLATLIEGPAGPVFLHLNTGQYYVRRGEYDKALQTYIKLLEEIAFPQGASRNIMYAAAEIVRLNAIQRIERDPMEIWREILSKRANDEMGATLLEYITKYLAQNQQGDSGRALQRWCVETFPDADVALVAIEKLPLSEDFYRRVSEAHPKTRAGAEAMWRLGNLLYDRGDYTQAIAAYEAFLKTGHHHANHEAALLRLAHSYEELARYDKAADAYRNALKIVRDEPERIRILKRIAKNYESQAKHAEAIEMCKQIIENYPSARVAPLAVKLGVYLDARESFRESREDQYLRDAAKFWLRYVDLHTGPSKSEAAEPALNWLSDFASEHPKSPEALLANYELAERYRRKGDMQEALKHAAVLTAACPHIEDAAALFLEIRAAKKKHEKIDAEIAELRAAKETPENLYRIAELLRDKSAYKDSIDVLTKLVHAYPNSEVAPRAQYEVAELYRQKLNDKPKMREAYRMFILLFPDHDLVDEALRRLKATVHPVR